MPRLGVFLSTLAPFGCTGHWPPSSSSRRALSREARPPWVGEVTLSQELRTARLPRPHVLVGYQWSHTGLRPGRKTSHNRYIRSFVSHLPQIRTCTSNASGSSRCGIAVPHTTGWFRGDTLVRHGVLGVVPTPRPQRGTPFAPRGPGGPFPRFDATMGRCDSLPSISPHFVSFAWRYHRFVPCSSPPARDGAVDQPGVGKPGLQPAVTMETARSPKFPGNPFDHSPCSSDPGVTRHADGSKCR